MSSYSLKNMDVLVQEPLAPMFPWKILARVLVTRKIGKPLLISGLYVIALNFSGWGRARMIGEVLTGAVGTATSGALLLLMMG